MDKTHPLRISREKKSGSKRAKLFVKRLVDIVASGIGLILLSPVFAIISLAIKLDTPGPVLYRHRRIGKDGKPFDLLKFRTMVSGGDDSNYMKYLQELIESSQNGKGKPYRKMDTDLRVIRVGGFLRKSYLDELPQLWNILIGEMSLVGPRPHVQFEIDHYPQGYLRRLSVKPGATGIWQVFGKPDCSFHALLDLDLQYVDHWCLVDDLKLIAQTFVIMLRGGDGSWTRMNKIVPQKQHSPEPAADAYPRESAEDSGLSRGINV